MVNFLSCLEISYVIYFANLFKYLQNKHDNICKFKESKIKAVQSKYHKDKPGKQMV